MRHWNFYYLIALGMAVSNLISISLVFGTKTMDGEYSWPPSFFLTFQTIVLDCLRLIGDEVEEKSSMSEDGTLGRVLRLKAVHCLALFCFFYVGAQISLGGALVLHWEDEVS